MLHTSYIELDKDALNNNICFLKEKAGADTRYSMVIKANAYGHGIEALLPMIEACGVDHFSVFSVAEAMRVQEVKQDHCDLMILGWVDDDYLEWVIEHDISFYVFTMERLRAAIERAKMCERSARIHIELETGMHRTGFCEDQLEEVAGVIREHSDDLILEGLCTHLAGAESMSNYGRINDQIDTFHRLCSWFRGQGLSPRYRHVACSAGMLNFPEATLDLVRIGIANYGFWPNEETRTLHLQQREDRKDPLRRVLSWKSAIMSLNQVGEGEYVSYGKSFLTSRDSRIATVPVGYGYGFSRTLSNRGHVLVRGKRAPVVGTVNMNMVVIDVTDIPGASVDDEVVLIGEQGGNRISVSSFSDMNNSMNYELLTRLPDHIPRQGKG